MALFSGQGGQREAHLQALRARADRELRERWRHALAAGGADADRLDATALARNRVAQPTLVAWQVAAYARLASEVPRPALVAGYSVGELAACSAAGAYHASAAITLAARRARIMDAAVDEPCGLAAVLGLAAAEVAALCARFGAAIAIRNGPRHFVVGGTQAALAALLPAALAAGATRAHPLAVATPAHTPLLAAAVPAFAEELRNVVKRPLTIPMLSGIDATRVRTVEEAVAALSRQLATTLDWAACMEAVAEAQPDAVLEIGPGNALARMLAEAVPGLPARSLDDFRDPAAAVAWLARADRRG